MLIILLHCIIMVLFNVNIIISLFEKINRSVNSEKQQAYEYIIDKFTAFFTLVGEFAE